MGDFSPPFNPATTNKSNITPPPPSAWDSFVQKVQSRFPPGSTLGQIGNNLEQRSVNLLHGDGCKADAQAYPLLPAAPAPKQPSNPSGRVSAVAPGARPLRQQQTIAPTQKPQNHNGGQGGAMGYVHALADNLGVAPILHQMAHPIKTFNNMQQQNASNPHPFQTALKRATVDNPMSGIPQLRGLAATAKNSVTEAGQAFNDLGITPYGYQTPKYGPNYAGAAVHAVRAIPILGSGLERGMNYAEQNGMGNPGNSYWQNVGKVWSSPKAMGTLTGIALQAAPLATSMIEKAGLGGSLTATDRATHNTFQAIHPFIHGNTSNALGTPRYASDLLQSNLTPEEISAHLKTLNIPYLAGRDTLHAPNINEYIDMLHEGKVAPAAILDGRTVWDGNHRIAAGYIQGTPPAVKQINPSGVSIYPVKSERPFKEIAVLPNRK